MLTAISLPKVTEYYEQYKAFITQYRDVLDDDGVRNADVLVRMATGEECDDLLNLYYGVYGHIPECIYYVVKSRGIFCEYERIDDEDFIIVENETDARFVRGFLNKEFNGDNVQLANKEESIMDDIIYVNSEEAIILDLESKRALPIKGAFSVEGVYCWFNEETERYEADFTLTVFYKDGETDANNYICYEGDSPEIAYHNLKEEIIDAVMEHHDRVA